MKRIITTFIKIALLALVFFLLGSALPATKASAECNEAGLCGGCRDPNYEWDHDPNVNPFCRIKVWNCQFDEACASAEWGQCKKTQYGSAFVGGMSYNPGSRTKDGVTKYCNDPEGWTYHHFECEYPNGSCSGGTDGGGDGCAQVCAGPKPADECNIGIYGDECVKGNGVAGCWQEDCSGDDGSDSCVPSCSGNLCGQSDGCGGGCSNSANGDPPAPGNLDPGNNDTINYSDNKKTISWGAASKADKYQTQLYPYGTNCNNANAHCETDNDRELKFTPVTGHYSWRVRGINTSCGTDNGAWTNLRNFYVVSPISGQVRNDPNDQARLVDEVCKLSGSGSSGVRPGTGSQGVGQGNGSYSDNVNASGNYSVTVPTGQGYLSVLQVGDLGVWNCTCPSSGCSYGGITAPTSGLNYFVSQDRDAWFQVTGGSLHANLGSVSSLIPATCTGTCDPYLIRADADGTVGVVSFTDSLSLGGFGGENISQTENDWQAQTAYGGTQTGYDYFARILQDDPNGIGTWEGGVPAVSGVYNALGVTRTGGADWNVDSGQTFVLLVDGDLVIDNNINVAAGGFLAIIASGNLTIADAVTNVEGVFIADAAIVTCESAGTCGGGGVAEQLIGEGIFVGWQGIALRRDFDGADNSIYPAETFTYRPDLQVNAYRYLLNPKYTWQEVAP